MRIWEHNPGREQGVDSGVERGVALSWPRPPDSALTKTQGTQHVGSLQTAWAGRNISG